MRAGFLEAHAGSELGMLLGWCSRVADAGVVAIFNTALKILRLFTVPSGLKVEV